MTSHQPYRRTRERLEFEVGFLDNFSRSIQKAVSQHPVDDTMVVRKRQIHHSANRERIFAVDIDHYGPLLKFAHAQNSHLGLIDDREAKKITLPTGIREGETPTCEVVGGDFALGNLAPQGFNFARDSDYRHSFG